MKPSYNHIVSIHTLVSAKSQCDRHSELHALGTSSALSFPADNDLATLGTALHDEPQYTIASPSDGQTIEKFVSEGFALGDGGQTTVLNLGGV